MRKRRKRRQITRSTKAKFDGIEFASKLELYMYKALKKAKIKNEYEGKTFTIIDSCDFPMSSFEKTKTKKILHDRGNKKLLGIYKVRGILDA